MCTTCFNQKVEYSMNVRQENYWLFLFSTSSFSFHHPENCHIIFVFSRLFFPPTLKIVRHFYALNEIHPNSFAQLYVWTADVSFVFLVQCLLFFFDMVSLFAFYLEQHPIVCPLKFRIMGYFSLSYCPLITLKHANSCYHRTCRNAWYLMEFKVLLVYKRHCLLSPV